MRRAWLIVLISGFGCGGDDASDDAATVTAAGTQDGTDGQTSVTDGPDAGTDDPSATDPSATDPSATDPSATDPSTDPTDATTADDTGTPTTNSGEVELPPPDGGLDYQLGGAYTPPDGVQIVSRDRNEAPAAGLYNVCYVNGYQAQPDEESFWLDDHPDLVLRDGNGDPVIDPDWDEMLLDISTAEKREALAVIVGGWIAGCADAGYQAVEIDNLDTYSRSDGLLSEDNAVEYMALLSASAHDVGLAIAQKNSAEILGRVAEMGTDFCVSEECSTYDECGDYVDVYGDAVLMIEYQQADFDKGCSDFPAHSIVLRDLYLVTPDDGAYVYDAC